ncbi:unnamed protein product [Adineta steineri]|uniref:G-protein coupled receptors family 1 profile domain-containing protein n=3 Tax=Adineta steineri TaxID=433720 RepID=A0A814H6F3_9BILA|nr:unnamed protein product [Adineta steineri]CAF1005035.1 unnamed protein product [Adineta steineri]CAF3815550.1 unnamed protein product [Adineta steineri]
MNTTSIHSVSVLYNKYSINHSAIGTLNDTSMRIEINEFIRQVNYWLMIVELIMVICGVCGNGMALIIINRRSLRDTSSSVFITYLAVFDTSVLIVHITSLVTLHSVQSYILHCFFAFLTDFVTFTSVWIMVIMTIERCIAVHSPFLAKRFCTRQRARYSMYILILIAFLLFSITFPIIYTIDKYQRKCGVRQQYQTLIRIIKPTIFYFIPDLILLVNLFIIYELCMARRSRTQTLINPENAIHQINAASFNRKQQQLTIMLVTVSLSFYLFTTPAIIDYIRQRNPPKYRNIKRLKMRFLRTNLTVLWLQMSAATNFVFYCLSGSKFRATCIETLDDIYAYIRIKFDDDYQRKRATSRIRSSSNFGLELRTGPYYGRRDTRRSTSVLQTFTYPLSNSSKRPSSDTIISSQLNSRRTSRCVVNVQEV